MNVDKSQLDKLGRQLRNERNGITSKAMPLTPDQLEIRELKKRIARIAEEKEILKKAQENSNCVELNEKGRGQESYGSYLCRYWC